MLHNKDLQKIQAMMMVQMRVTGSSNVEIAKALNMSTDTVERRLKFADKAGLFIEYEQHLLQSLVPKAMKAIETALEDGDAETALEVLRSTGILKDPKAPKTQTEQSENDDLARAIKAARVERELMEGTVDGSYRELDNGTSVDGRRSLAGLIEQGDETDQAPTGQARIELIAPVEQVAKET